MNRPADRHRVSRRLSALLVGPLALVLAATPVVAQEIVVGPPPGLAVVPGGVVEVPIEVDMSGAGGVAIASLQFEVRWDPALLTYTGSAPEAPGDWSLTVNADQAASGVLVVGLFSPGGATATFTALSLEFAAASVSQARTALIDLSISAAGDPAANDLLSIVVARDLPLCIGLAGLLGDLTDDATINIIDAQQVARYAVGMAPPPDPATAERLGDVTEDGTTNIIDAQQIARHAVGLAAPGAPNLGQSVPGGCAVATQSAVVQAMDMSDPSNADVTGTVTFSGLTVELWDGAEWLLVTDEPTTATLEVGAGSAAATLVPETEIPEATYTMVRLTAEDAQLDVAVDGYQFSARVQEALGPVVLEEEIDVTVNADGSRTFVVELEAVRTVVVEEDASGSATVTISGDLGEAMAVAS